MNQSSFTGLRLRLLLLVLLAVLPALAPTLYNGLEQRRMAAADVQTGAKFRELLGFAPEAIVIMDREGHIQLVNPRPLNRS